ncbi:MAG: hypothetical protein QNJ13_02480 [Paracoccaceae bacterium]|nr:hypothetical protein [Paracoccaceae bacterium]
MKDARRLKNRIRKLNAPARQSEQGREIASGADASPLAAVLLEVDETMLPRRLVFSRGDARLSLSAGNRRLIGIEHAEGSAEAPAKPLMGVSLTRPDVALLGRLRDALTTALAGSEPIFVRTEPAADGQVDFAAGTTAQALASAWGVDLSADAGPPDAPDEAGGLDMFLTTAPSLARAWVRLSSGGIADTGGDPATLGRLQAFAGSADMANIDMVPASGSNRFVAIGRSPDDGDCLLFVSAGLEAALLMIPAETLDQAKKTWQDAVR